MKELDSVLKSIKNKTFLPLYFFHGEEPFYIDTAVKAFENDVLAEDERDFGQSVLYGRDTNMAEIVAMAQQIPMFGEYNLIIVKEAQDLRLDEKERALLENYTEKPVPSTILVFGYKNKKLAGTTKLAKLLSKKGLLFLSSSIRDNELPKWIADECQRMQIPTAPNISHLLAEYLGNDLSRIANELNKLKMILKPGETLDEKKVETYIGISKDYNVFELQKALGQKDTQKAMKIAHYIGKNPKSNPIQMTIGSLYNFFSNLIIYHTMKSANPQSIATALGINPFFIKDYAEAARFYSLKHSTRIISILREMDMKSKGLGVNNMEEAEILKEMTYKILNVDKIKIQL
ncbi:MAG: DNA polymerase III subunit delta [Bergeyella zoohelcum]|nr:DNA polymerase III subunit delta [Bergeyella zoohelcum]